MLGLAILLLAYGAHSRGLFVLYHLVKAFAIAGGFHR
jgi:hypothetical protein